MNSSPWMNLLAKHGLCVALVSLSFMLAMLVGTNLAAAEDSLVAEPVELLGPPVFFGDSGRGGSGSEGANVSAGGDGLSVNSTGLPEPGTLVLLGSGALLLAAGMRRSRAARA